MISTRLSMSGVATYGDLRAHPTLTHPHVDVPILPLAIGSFVVVVLLSTLIRSRPRTAGDESSATPPATMSWAGNLSRAQWCTRIGSVLILLVAIVAGRAGNPDELENLAPALVVGAGWPLLLLGCLLLGRLWRWIDPWDTIARVLAPGPSAPAPHVYPAWVLAAPLGWFLAVHQTPLAPRDVGLALAAYSLATIAGAVALGRRRWLSAAEPVGLVLAWVGLLGRRGYLDWRPPPGAAGLIGLGIGALTFSVVRRTEVWSSVLASQHPVLWSTVGYLVLCGLLAGAAELAARAASGAQERAGVAQSLLPVLVGVGLAVAVARDRLFTSVQLLPGLIGDPLGRGWDLFGTPTDGLVVSPLAAVWLVTLQLSLVIGAHLFAAMSVPRPMEGDARLPVIGTLGVSVAVSVTALSLH
jgi:hypothetical protein